eukprot:SAG31_NODE_3522_length_4162_cov_14.600541_4_plen_43_part_01
MRLRLYSASQQQQCVDEVKFLEREPWPGPVGYRRRPGPAFSLN